MLTNVNIEVTHFMKKGKETEVFLKYLLHTKRLFLKVFQSGIKSIVNHKLGKYCFFLLKWVFPWKSVNALRSKLILGCFYTEFLLNEFGKVGFLPNE